MSSAPRHREGLRRESLPHVVGILVSETPGNLLGRTTLTQVGPDILPQPRIQQCAGPPGLTGSGGRSRLGRTSAIGTAPRRVAGVLTAHRAGRAAQHRGQRAQRLPLGQA